MLYHLFRTFQVNFRSKDFENKFSNNSNLIQTNSNHTEYNCSSVNLKWGLIGNFKIHLRSSNQSSKFKIL